MNRYTHSDLDSWSWSRAQNSHVPQIVQLVDQNYSSEIDSVIFSKNPTRLHYHLHSAILHQTYLPSQEFVNVAVQDDSVIAWSWLERGKYTVYADEEMAVAEFLHVDLTLSVRTRIRLIAQAIEQWIAWALINQIPVICSTSIRSEQAAFMRLHEQFGFEIRGSIAYKKIKGE